MISHSAIMTVLARDQQGGGVTPIPEGDVCGPSSASRGGALILTKTLANLWCHTFGRCIILSSVAGPDANEDGVELLALMTGGVAAVEVSVVLLVEVKDEGVEDR